MQISWRKILVNSLGLLIWTIVAIALPDNGEQSGFSNIAIAAVAMLKASFLLQKKM